VGAGWRGDLVRCKLAWFVKGCASVEGLVRRWGRSGFCGGREEVLRLMVSVVGPSSCSGQPPVK
jgi:hypothetical protein